MRADEGWIAGTISDENYERLTAILPAKEQVARFESRKADLAAQPVEEQMDNLRESLLLPIRSAETAEALHAALERVFERFQLSLSPPESLPMRLDGPYDHGAAEEITPEIEQVIAWIEQNRGPLATSEPSRRPLIVAPPVLSIPDDSPFWDSIDCWLIPVPHEDVYLTDPSGPSHS